MVPTFRLPLLLPPPLLGLWWWWPRPKNRNKSFLNTSGQLSGKHSCMVKKNFLDVLFVRRQQRNTTIIVHYPLLALRIFKKKIIYAKTKLLFATGWFGLNKIYFRLGRHNYQKTQTLVILPYGLWNFHWLGPLDRVSHRVAISDVPHPLPLPPRYSKSWFS